MNYITLDVGMVQIKTVIGYLEQSIDALNVKVILIIEVNKVELKNIINPCTICKYSCPFEVRPCERLSEYYAKLNKSNKDK
jgi:hypothetical protein